jgi:hypothetical protein
MPIIEAANILLSVVVAAVSVLRKEGQSIMKFLVSTTFLVLSLVASATAQTNWVDVATESGEEAAPGLKIVKARARQETAPVADNTRAFTIVVENTGEQAIKSIDFLFEPAADSSEQAADANGNHTRCGFITADLYLNPGNAVTIQWELPGNHCIPLSSSKQIIRVQQIVYSDGSRWRRLGHETSGGQRVK